MDAKQVPLRELLASVPADARLVIDDADGKGTRFIPVGRLCQEAAAALAEPEPPPEAQTEAEKIAYCAGWWDALAKARGSEERNFCPRCGKRTQDIHTCTPPA